MTALLAARCEHSAATLGLHTRTKAVRFGAAALPWLKSTLWQSNPPYGLDTARELPESHPRAAYTACGHCEPGWPWSPLCQALLPDFRQLSEFTSVLATRSGGQESTGVAYREGKSDTPCPPAWVVMDSNHHLFRQSPRSNVSTIQATHYQRWKRVLPLLLFFPRKRVALEIKRDLLQAECGRPEQSIKLAALVFLVLHDEGVLLTEICFAKIRCR
jgi:hypothetical protein